MIAKPSKNGVREISKTRVKGEKHRTDIVPGICSTATDLCIEAH